ncbi:hypothetical protein [Streptomyces longisporoflavus]|uniref:hypothetical protein n=1 Tax=Streptomyces longisporoflavus TaxID=28044 RepID=UPI001E481C03|nr:hypothetical protein [Streptomyces longisporoflavus]
MTVEQMAGSSDQVAARQQARGTVSLVLGIVAVAMMVCPLLLPAWVRLLPLYFLLPVGVSAVVSGIVALRRMRDHEGADRYRARAGVVLGAAAIVIPLTVITLAIWVLSQVETY